MVKDERLEVLSDKIRMGIPVGMAEAIEAIEYQKALQLERKNRTILSKLRAWLGAW